MIRIGKEDCKNFNSGGQMTVAGLTINGVVLIDPAKVIGINRHISRTRVLVLIGLIVLFGILLLLTRLGWFRRP